MGGYPYGNGPWFGPYWAIGLGFGYPFGFGYGSGFGYPFGFGYGSGLSFAYGSGNWAIGVNFGWPGFGYQPASVYAPIYAPAYGYGYSSSSAVIVEPPVTVAPPAAEIVPPPAVESAQPAPEQPAPVDFLSQGTDLLQAGKYPEAARALRHAVVDDPQNGIILGLTGEALLAAGSLDEAAGALQRSLAITPEAYWASTTAQMIRWAPAQATEDLRKAVEKDPGKPSLRFLAAYQAFGQGEYQQAQSHLDELLKKAPDDAVAKKLRDQSQKLATGKE